MIDSDRDPLRTGLQTVPYMKVNDVITHGFQGPELSRML